MKLSVPDDTVNVNENIYISFSSATKKTKEKKNHQVLLNTSMH